MIRAAVIFLLAFIVDVCWTKYTLATAAKQAFNAASWSGAIILVGSISTILYVEDHWLVIPALIGGWLGTFLTVRREP